MWIGGTAAWLAAAALPRICESVMYIICMNKNVIAHLLPVKSGPFNNRSRFSYAFASVGMQEEVDGTTTAGDWVGCSFGDGRAIFYVVADAGGCREGCE